MNATIYWYLIDVHWSTVWSRKPEVKRILANLDLPAVSPVAYGIDGTTDCDGVYSLLSASTNPNTEMLLALTVSAVADVRVLTNINDVVDCVGLKTISALHDKVTGDLADLICQEIVSIS